MHDTSDSTPIHGTGREGAEKARAWGGDLWGDDDTYLTLFIWI